MRHASILVVDDEKLIRWSLGERLRQAGHRVLFAESSSETLKALDDGVALVVLDLKLPDNEGLELFRAIRLRYPNCRVIMMTAECTPEIADEALRGGAYRVMQKPFRLDEMADLVETALA